jgi:hypothetical protein
MIPGSLDWGLLLFGLASLVLVGVGCALLAFDWVSRKLERSSPHDH